MTFIVVNIADIFSYIGSFSSL